MSNADIVRKCFDAYRNKDRKALEALLSEDFKFTSPYDDAIDKATYFERCWPNSERIKSFTVEKIFAEGVEAFVLYKCVNKKGDEFRNTEFHRFRQGKIREVHVYFGATYRDGVFVKDE